jgi:peroxiredoxin
MADEETLTPMQAAFRVARDLDAPINERLAIIARQVRRGNPAFADGVERMVARLQAADAGATAPQVGDILPHFALPDDTGHVVTLRETLQHGPAAISFNRGHWCPYCRLQMAAMSRLDGAVRAVGGQLLTIVPERRKFAALMRREAQAPFPVLIDMDNGYALSLDLAIWVGEEMESMMAEIGLDLPGYLRGGARWADRRPVY